MTFHVPQQNIQSNPQIPSQNQERPLLPCQSTLRLTIDIGQLPISTRTNARKAAYGIFTLQHATFNMFAGVVSSLTFVKVGTSWKRASITAATHALEASWGIATCIVGIAVVCVSGTLIDIYTAYILRDLLKAWSAVG
eukprot:TRINITY_DN10376_c0_g1_i1.p2 TRINITY_DN10376_c0_g1~~TRINITY_DN10376_c0_g1_i1.p2  ORF type:complete len:138 (-),score=10.01 TRINITY_DN10376_c0_g1_i1:187-600(-)